MEGDAGTTTDSPTGPLAVFAVALAISGLLVYRYTAADENEFANPGPEASDATAVGRAAGRAADRIETSSLSNAIYRAWREMTDAVDVADPETTTPAEFAEAAVAAGVDRDDVERLTELFREVRYGDAPVTPERERQARETLRRIEETYAAAADAGGREADGGDRE